MPWIFSFAELGPTQIEILLGHAPFCSLPASTPNFKVSFKGRSRKWTGSTATLEKSRGNWVYGSALLVSSDELERFDNYYQNHVQITIPILLDATKDKVQAIAYILNNEETYGQPSDDYVKELLKHLKFFWGKTRSLENFGIVLAPSISAPKEKKEKPSVEKTTVPEIADFEDEKPKPKGRKKTK